MIKSKFLTEQVARGLLSNLAGTKEQILKYVFLVQNQCKSKQVFISR